jgi:hypothetical protein
MVISLNNRLLETVFFVQSMPSPYNESQLPLQECTETGDGRVGVEELESDGCWPVRM